MDLLTNAINAAVVTGVGFLLWLATRGIRREVRELRTEMNARFEALETRLDARIEAVRSDLTQVALAVGVRREAEAGG